jgi:hypothetical protein
MKVDIPLFHRGLEESSTSFQKMKTLPHLPWERAIDRFSTYENEEETLSLLRVQRVLARTATQGKQPLINS